MQISTYANEKENVGVGGVNQKDGNYGKLVPGVELVPFIWKMETDEAKKIYQQREAEAKFPNAGIKNKIKFRQLRLRLSVFVFLTFFLML